jgi:hypothetical protein
MSLNAAAIEGISIAEMLETRVVETNSSDIISSVQCGIFESLLEKELNVETVVALNQYSCSSAE